MPTVFLRSGKTEFELSVSFSVYPRHRKTEFEIPFSFSVFLLHRKWNSSFCFRLWFPYDFGERNSNTHFRFSSFVFVRYWKTKFNNLFSFFVCAFLSFPYFIEPEEWRHFLLVTKSLETRDDVLARKRNKMAALENILDEVFVRRFLMEENNSYEDPLVVIKNRYPNLRGCSLRSIKWFCSYHSIKKKMPVSDGTVDIAVQGAITEVNLCCKSIIVTSSIFFSKRGEGGEYFLTSCVNNFSGKWGRGWVELTSDGDFLPLLESNFGMNRIFSVVLVYCDKMSTIASFGAKEEIKNILDSGRFFKDFQ